MDAPLVFEKLVTAITRLHSKLAFGTHGILPSNHGVRDRILIAAERKHGLAA